MTAPAPQDVGFADSSIAGGTAQLFTLWRPKFAKTVSLGVPSESYRYFWSWDTVGGSWSADAPQWLLRLAAIENVPDLNGSPTANTALQIRNLLRAFRALSKADFTDTDGTTNTVKFIDYQERQVEPASRFAPAGAWIVTVVLSSDT